MTDPNFSRPGAVDLSSLTNPATPSAGGYVMEVGEADFQELAKLSSQHPVIVEFHSARDTSGPALSRDLAELVNAGAGRYLLARVNVDAEPRLAQALQVEAVPTVIALIAGQLAPLFQGTRSRQEISAVLEQVAQLAVGNGITGRAQPVAGGPADGEPQAEAPLDPRFEAADEALQAGDYALAVEEFDKLLTATPLDAEVIAGRAQASLLARSAEFDAAAVVAEASAQPDDVAVQLKAADLEIIQGASESAFDRLLGLAATVGADDRETIRLRILELFEVVGRTDSVVLAARRRLSTLLY